MNAPVLPIVTPTPVQPRTGKVRATTNDDPNDPAAEFAALLGVPSPNAPLPSGGASTEPSSAALGTAGGASSAGPVDHLRMAVAGQPESAVAHAQSARAAADHAAADLVNAHIDPAHVRVDHAGVDHAPADPAADDHAAPAHGTSASAAHPLAAGDLPRPAAPAVPAPAAPLPSATVPQSAPGTPSAAALEQALPAPQTAASQQVSKAPAPAPAGRAAASAVSSRSVRPLPGRAARATDAARYDEHADLATRTAAGRQHAVPLIATSSTPDPAQRAFAHQEPAATPPATPAVTSVQASTPAAPSAPAQQIVQESVVGTAPHAPLTSALARLRGRNGQHEITVALHPAELGAVTIRATIHGADISIALNCAEADAHATVAAALPALHAELQQNGFGSVDVSLGHHANARGGAHAEPKPGGDAPRNATPERDTRDEPKRPARDRALDRWL